MRIHRLRLAVFVAGALSYLLCVVLFERVRERLSFDALPLCACDKYLVNIIVIINTQRLRV